MVGTHVPDDRDVVESALQRMREAFEALRDGSLGPARAEEEFLAGYDTARDMVSALFLARRTSELGAAVADNVCDVVILGGGSGGYATALRAAELGKSVVLVDPGHVDALERRLYPERRALPRLVSDLPGVQERLGRNAAAVQARPADLVLLHKYYRLAQLSSPQRGRIAATTAAENYQVAPVVCHGYSYSLTLRQLV